MFAKIEPILCWLAIASLVAWTIYAGLIKPVIHPTPTTTQTGGVAYNYTISTGFGGCTRLPPIQEQMAGAIKPVTDKVASTVKAVVK